MTRKEIIANVAKRLNISSDTIQEVHDQYWHNIVKKDVMQPQFDNYELLGLGVFQVKPFLLRKTLLKEIRKLRGSKQVLKKKPNSVKYKNQVAYYEERVRYLWKLKNEIT